ncbi:transposon tf2-6 polyprotein [Plakobranchus ocellatus]|uniref:Transposon tf2-6 polyprotein n=1 Tax=Plakobranchus ocellatus TaxID=259542 RepID=A0AAV3ZF65_9GAST|nr:transposon tf2-6 polyprotein [Plakobranchus ocellatus]
MQQYATLKDFEQKIRFKPDVQPIFHRQRPVPIAVEKDQDSAQQSGIKKGICEPTQFNPYGTPVETIKKKSAQGQASIRVCGHYRVTADTPSSYAITFKRIRSAQETIKLWIVQHQKIHLLLMLFIVSDTDAMKKLFIALRNSCLWLQILHLVNFRMQRMKQTAQDTDTEGIACHCAACNEHHRLPPKQPSHPKNNTEKF